MIKRKVASKNLEQLGRNWCYKDGKKISNGEIFYRGAGNRNAGKASIKQRSHDRGSEQHPLPLPWWWWLLASRGNGMLIPSIAEQYPFYNHSLYRGNGYVQNFDRRVCRSLNGKLSLIYLKVWKTSKKWSIHLKYTWMKKNEVYVIRSHDKRTVVIILIENSAGIIIVQC